VLRWVYVLISSPFFQLLLLDLLLYGILL